MGWGARMAHVELWAASQDPLDLAPRLLHEPVDLLVRLVAVALPRHALALRHGPEGLLPVESGDRHVVRPVLEVLLDAVPSVLGVLVHHVEDAVTGEVGNLEREAPGVVGLPLVLGDGRVEGSAQVPSVDAALHPRPLAARRLPHEAVLYRTIHPTSLSAREANQQVP